MLDWAYTEEVKEHFTNPKNILDDESQFQEDGKGLVGNIKCGDQMLMLIKVDRDKGVIQDCRWKTYGCASAIASTSVLSEMVKGMTLKDAFNVSPHDIMNKLGSLPEHKVHCSVLGDKALREAINDYYKRNNMLGNVREDRAKVICQCMNVTDHDIEEAVLEGARSYYQLQEYTKIGTVCGQCKDESIQILEANIKKHFGERKD